MVSWQKKKKQWRRKGKIIRNSWWRPGKQRGENGRRKVGEKARNPGDRVLPVKQLYECCLLTRQKKFVVFFFPIGVHAWIQSQVRIAMLEWLFSWPFRVSASYKQRLLHLRNKIFRYDIALYRNFNYFFSLAAFAGDKNCGEIYKSGERKDGVHHQTWQSACPWCVLWPNNSRWGVDSVPEGTEWFCWFLFPYMERVQSWFRWSEWWTDIASDWTKFTA